MTHCHKGMNVNLSATVEDTNHTLTTKRTCNAKFPQLKYSLVPSIAFNKAASQFKTVSRVYIIPYNKQSYSVLIFNKTVALRYHLANYIYHLTIYKYITLL